MFKIITPWASHAFMKLLVACLERAVFAVVVAVVMLVAAGLEAEIRHEVDAFVRATAVGLEAASAGEDLGY